ncbi:uncharacterized protein zgc:194930 [Megalops cyprinoides]|uniref:uncharacterized protein zgc:194930 n=1 Tax=Megalops cyprinoides TaxID=118141 RepID=UPI001863D085|nr:uncharacterized protein zgc:194930 [Megalops cyprinoides]XP_036407340.1 uncharacterized protein zgc:194930 [Megalops cyprinoides]XP_036407341.1 uncharacterized protein zgc:194930 [Megalops cyprinoides]
MGCRCCRMIKSYIYDPSVPVDVHGRKRDTATTTLYQGKPREAENMHKVQGFHNLGYTHKYADGVKQGTAKLEIDNNQINRLHAAPSERTQDHTLKVGTGDSTLYILHPGESPLKCAPPGHTPLPEHNALQCSSPGVTFERLNDHLIGRTPQANGDPFSRRGHGSPHSQCGDEADADSVLSGRSEEVHTSTTSLSSADTRERPLQTAGESRGSEGEEEEEDEGDSGSITDSEVAEALAALDAATAGEDYE